MSNRAKDAWKAVAIVVAIACWIAALLTIYVLALEVAGAIGLLVAAAVTFLAAIWVIVYTGSRR